MDKNMRFIVKNGEAVICNKMKIAKTMYTRMKGMMFTEEFPVNDYDGLLIQPCNSIHSFFMKMEFHAIFLDKQDKVVKVVESMKPWRMSKMYIKANKVLEVPNNVEIKNLSKGDQLEVVCIN